jgi:hypothetical protein
MTRRISSVALVLAVALGSAACGKDSPMCRMRQGEAKADLKALDAAQTKFRETHAHFARSLEELHFKAPDPNYYELSIESASVDAYSAKALGTRSVAGDEWRINELGNPIIVTSSCQ